MTTTFENAKIGDRVWDILSGWCEIIDTGDGDTYSILVRFPDKSLKAYTVGGLCHENDVTRSLFWDEVVIDAPSKPLPDLKVDTKVLVWCGSVPKTKRYFSHFNHEGKIVCFSNGKTSWTTKQTEEWDSWELAE